MLTPNTRSTKSSIAYLLLLFSPLCVATSTMQEPTRLSGLIRQLDLIERLAEDSARLPRDETSRYHFDYPRFRDDVQRMRQGIRDHLSPQRAQPRDPLPLSGDYRQEAETGHEPE